MMWIHDYQVQLSGYDLAQPRTLYRIELIKRSEQGAQAQCPAQFVQSRSYSEFRALWKLLLSKSTARQGMSKVTDYCQRNKPVHCSCGTKGSGSHGNNQACSFSAIVKVLGDIRFPAKSITPLLRKSKEFIEGRRQALEAFLVKVAEFFLNYSKDFLQQKLLLGECALLNEYASFVGACRHFPSQGRAGVRRPLSLEGWRGHLETHLLDAPNEDDEISDFQVIATSSLDYELDVQAIRKNQGGSERLPCLDVKPVNVETMQSFMEDFCNHILLHYGQDLTELASPELTIARRWELCLYVACRIGHSYAVQLILFYYADANTCLEDGSTCLSVAARMGHLRVIKLLLDEGADVNLANKAGVTPLIAACRNGSLEAVKMLLRVGADIGASSARGTHPIHAAIVSRNPAIVELLLKNGANVNVTTQTGISPLHFGARLGCVRICEILLKYNADLEMRTRSDSDAMMIASSNGHVAVCELLQVYMKKRLKKPISREFAVLPTFRKTPLHTTRRCHAVSAILTLD